MKATLIIHIKTGHICDVIRGEIKPAEGVDQKKEFVHMAVDLPDEKLIEFDNKEEETRPAVDLEKQLDPVTLACAIDKDADTPFVGNFKTPITSVIEKKVVAEVIK